MSKQDISWPGFKIKALRLNSKTNPSDVAKALDITPTYLSLIENGKRKPSKKVICKAMIFFSVDEQSITEKPSFVFDIKEKLAPFEQADQIAALHYLLATL